MADTRIRQEQIGSGAAADGDVLTADGAGGSAFEVPAGGTPDAADVTYTPAVATDWDGDADPGNADDALDQLAERVDDLEGAGGTPHTILSATHTDTNTAAPDDGDVLTWDATPGEWKAAPPPAGGAVDAADVTYTPAVATDWDGDADPGNVDGALDQLAERVDDLEGAGGGSVATDAIWDAKGDLAAGTGANTAAKVTAGANLTVPVYDSAQSAGILPAVPQPQIVTAYANADDAHTANSTWEDINSMSVSITPPFASAKLLCMFTCRIKMDSANWEGFSFRFDLDGATQSELWTQAQDANPATTRIWLCECHTVFAGVSAAPHTVKAQWASFSSLNCTIKERRLTVMACQ